MINLWLILRDDAKEAINDALNTPEEDYTGPVNTKTRRIFEKMSCRTQVQKMFKSPEIGGNVYHLYSLYINTIRILPVINAVYHLTTEYPNHIIVGGAWRWDGSQAPGYPPHAQLIKLMPDVWNDVTEQYDPAVEVTDVTLMLGQQPRDFS